MSLTNLTPPTSGEESASEAEQPNLDRYRRGGRTIDFRDCRVLEREPEVANGARLFKGTPIGLDSVLCELAQNRNLDETVEEFFGQVEREAIEEALYHMAQKLDGSEI